MKELAGKGTGEGLDGCSGKPPRPLCELNIFCKVGRFQALFLDNENQSGYITNPSANVKYILPIVIEQWGLTDTVADPRFVSSRLSGFISLLSGHSEKFFRRASTECRGLKIISYYWYYQ